MAFQEGVLVRNARLDSIETAVGTSAVLKIFSGAEPANCAQSDPSGLLCTITLPSDWMNAASSGSKTLLGSWSASASGTGTAASFRIYDNGVNTCHLQGSVGQGSGDLSLNNSAIVATQTVTVSTFTLTAGNS